MSDTDMLYMASLEKRNAELEARIAELEDKHWNECRQIAHYEDELRKAKELLKKLEDTIDDLCNDVSDSPCGCDCCSYVDTINEDECCEVYRLRAEALALIGKDTNVPAREDGEQNDT